jgi:hypothetical protein
VKSTRRARSDGFSASDKFHSVLVLLDSHEYLPQHLACCTSELGGNRPSDSQALAPDHVVKTLRSRRGHDVRRSTLGEEHDATGHVRLTLLNGKVTAQLKVTRSC